MRETEILRGLQKAKATARSYAEGTAMVSPRLAAFRAANPVVHQNSFAQHAANMESPQAAPIQTMPVSQPSAPSPMEAPLGTGLARGAMGVIQNYKVNQQHAIENIGSGNGQYAAGTAKLAGPGTTTSDSIPAMLSADEAVLPAKTVKAVGATNIARLIEQTNGKPPKGPVQAGTIGEPGELGEPSITEAGRIDSGGLHRAHYAVGYVDDPVARAAANRAAVPTAQATPAAPVGAAPIADAAPILPEATAAPRAGVGGILDTAKDLASSGLNKARSVLGGGAPAVAPAAEAGSAFAPAGAGFARLASGARAAGSLGSKAVSSGLVPAAVIASDIKSYNTPTAEYQARTGIDNELGARAAGVMQDVGNTVTGGLAGKLGDYLAGNSSTPTAAAPASTPLVQTPATKVDAGTIAAQDQAVQGPALKGDGGDLTGLRKAFEATKFKDGDTWGDREDKNHDLKVLQAQAGVGEAQAQGQASLYGTDAQLAGNRLANRANLYKLQNDLHNTKVQQNTDTFQSLFTDTDKKGAPVKGGANYSAALDHLVGTVGKHGLDIGDLSPQDLNAFKEAYDPAQTADEFNNSLKGKIFNTLLQNHPAVSRDVTRYNATDADPGVLFPSTTRGVAGSVPNVDTYQGGNYFQPPSQDLIDRTQAQLTKARR